MGALAAWARARGDRWIDARHRPAPGAVVLRRRRLYILPSVYGIGFMVLLLILFLWSANYSNSMGFGLTFLMVAVGLNVMWRCHANLEGLALECGQVEPTFVGAPAVLPVHVVDQAGLSRFGVAFDAGTGDASAASVSRAGQALARVPLPSTQRGRHSLPRIRVHTRFPMDLFKAWSWVRFSGDYWVYPAPRGDAPPPAARPDPASGTGAVGGDGNDDFAGLRQYVPGDAPRHVAWRASARRDDQLLVKRFHGESAGRVWLDWSSTDGDVERRLSQLCRWVLDEERGGQRYGLRLPDTLIEPDRGLAHCTRCLQALALYGQAPA